ncbi:hypothetical protein HRbin01_00058 [archaeon HR01]|nr:hypothetical protein HRbin01_00058 [archaeon HR01]
MRPDDILDTSSKILTLASIILYFAGHIDLSMMLALLGTASAFIATLFIRRLGRMVRKMLEGPTYTLKNLKGSLAVVSTSCRICTHPSRQMIEAAVREAGIDAAIQRFPEIRRRDLVSHIRRHPTLNQEMEGGRDIRREMWMLVERLKELYAKLELFDSEYLSGGREITARDYINSVGERLDIISKIRDLLLSIAKSSEPQEEVKDLTELLRSLSDVEDGGQTPSHEATAHTSPQTQA